jgi:excisionase family DNA binding protein
LEDPAVAEIMTTKELAAYLRLHEVTICKYASEGLIPAIRIGPIWRFDKDVIDEWIAGEQDNKKSRKGEKSSSGREN